MNEFLSEMLIAKSASTLGTSVPGPNVLVMQYPDYLSDGGRGLRDLAGGHGGIGATRVVTRARGW